MWRPACRSDYRPTWHSPANFTLRTVPNHEDANNGTPSAPCRGHRLPCVSTLAHDLGPSGGAGLERAQMWRWRRLGDFLRGRIGNLDGADTTRKPDWGRSESALRPNSTWNWLTSPGMGRHRPGIGQLRPKLVCTELCNVSPRHFANLAPDLGRCSPNMADAAQSWPKSPEKWPTPPKSTHFGPNFDRCTKSAPGPIEKVAPMYVGAVPRLSSTQLRPNGTLPDASAAFEPSQQHPRRAPIGTQLTTSKALRRDRE